MQNGCARACPSSVPASAVQLQVFPHRVSTVALAASALVQTLALFSESREIHPCPASGRGLSEGGGRRGDPPAVSFSKVSRTFVGTQECACRDFRILGFLS